MEDPTPPRPVAPPSIGDSGPPEPAAGPLPDGPPVGDDVRIVLGPALRHVGEDSATIWVETTGSCLVTVRAERGGSGATRTFEIEGHHYALVVVTGLLPGTRSPYRVEVDGRRAWPERRDPRPVPVIPTLQPSPGAAAAAAPPGAAAAAAPTSQRLDIVFGSCRVDRPNIPPYTLEPEQHPDGVGIDALVALSRDCQAGRRRLPDLLVMLGDQVYADEGLSPGIRDRQIRRRGPDSEPKDEVLDFEEYTWLYHDTWGDPDVRWLLSTLPSAMIFDDHDVRDDWNTSLAWRQEVARLPWWPTRIAGAYMSYWIYQHIGNLAPHMLEREQVYRDVISAAEQGRDAAEELRAFARQADDEVDGRKGSCWSYLRRLGPVRLVVVDSRSGRMLENDRRQMLSEGEWATVDEELVGDIDHLVVVTSLPLVLDRALHDVEAWDEALADGAWGPRWARWGESLRQRLDLEHWAAFERSFRRMVSILGEVASGRRGEPPATVLVLSGDVHHAYVAKLRYPARVGAVAPVVQIVSSPFRNAFPRRLQRGFRLAHTRPLRAVGELLRRSVSLPLPPVDWRISTGPLYGNGLACLTLNGRAARVTLERAVEPGSGPTLRVVHEEQLSPAGE